jgi:predicted metal-dependent HD superfamily phosphohydrolase
LWNKIPKMEFTVNTAKSLWQQSMTELDISSQLSKSLWRSLEDLYSQPQRHYHTLAHIDAMASALARFAPEAPLPLRFAVIYHDAVYDSRRRDNEERSARLAVRSLGLLKVPSAGRRLTGRLILRTRFHEPLAGEFRQLSEFFLDLDLLILGQSESEYDSYAVSIRREYDWVSETEYRQARAGILRSFLERPQIYFTGDIRTSYESQARANLERELGRLLSP